MKLVAESLPNAQYKLIGYEIRTRREIHKHEGGLIEFVKQHFICKRLEKYEPKCSKCICSGFKILKKNWVCFSIYRPPSTENVKTFFQEMKESVKRCVNMKT